MCFMRNGHVLYHTIIMLLDEGEGVRGEERGKLQYFSCTVMQVWIRQ